MSAPTPSSRASLLAGLRTGGVRSASATIPQTAGPTTTSFPLPRFASHVQRQNASFPEQDEYSELEDQHSAYVNHYATRSMPMTAAVDGPNNQFAFQQTMPLNPANTAAINQVLAAANALAQPPHLQQQALNMQLMQLELLRMQNAQAQQLQAQAELMARAQQVQNRRTNLAFNPPASAGPMASGFDLRSATLSAQMRRANQAEQLKAQLGIGTAPPADDQVPMTAALGGKFGSRSTSLNVPSRLGPIVIEQDEDNRPPPTPSSTTVISGGTSLGKLSSNNVNATEPSKSDAAVSWRRRGNTRSVLGGNNRSVTSPAVRITPPPGESLRSSPPPATSPTSTKARPLPLRFATLASQPVAIAVDSSDPADIEQDNDDTSSTGSSVKSAASNSSPTTPRSSSSNEGSLSPREEATKKLYEGLGFGRPTSSPSPAVAAQAMASHRMVSQPMRQPRGPPSGLDELGPKNFATRIRRQAIGGLGMLMGARERREVVEAY